MQRSKAKPKQTSNYFRGSMKTTLETRIDLLSAYSILLNSVPAGCLSIFSVLVPGASRQRYLSPSKRGATRASFGSFRIWTKLSFPSKITQCLKRNKRHVCIVQSSFDTSNTLYEYLTMSVVSARENSLPHWCFRIVFTYPRQNVTHASRGPSPHPIETTGDESDCTWQNHPPSWIDAPIWTVTNGM